MSFEGNVGQIQPTKETSHLTLTTLTINWTGDLGQIQQVCVRPCFLGRKLQLLVFSLKKQDIFLNPVKLLGGSKYFLQTNDVSYPSKSTQNVGLERT